MQGITFNDIRIFIAMILAVVVGEPCFHAITIMCS